MLSIRFLLPVLVSFSFILGALLTYAFHMQNSTLLMLSILLIVIAVAASILIYRYLHKRIRSFVAAVKLFCDEERKVDIDISGSDEVSELTSTFVRLRDNVLETKRTTKEQKLELQKTIKLLDEYKRAMDESNIVSKSDLKGTITYVNDNFCEVSGYSKEEAMGRPHNIVRHPDVPKIVFRDIWSTIQSKKTWQGILKNRKKNGGHYYVDITILPILDAHNEIEEYIAIRHDVTELVEKKEEMERIAHTDFLTEFGNRNKLLLDIQEAKEPKVALVDIDRFSEVNDFYGIKVGDRVIRETAKVIQESLPDGFGIYRVHGDQFCVLCKEDLSEELFVEKIEHLSYQISSSHLVIEGKEISIQTTMGISFEVRSIILSTADMAKKMAKNERKHILVYSKERGIDKEYENNLAWALKLKKAFGADLIVPFFQPIYNNATGEIEKYEALVRMIDEEDGAVISPFHFLDIAKRSKQYTRLTKTVLQKACERFATLDKEVSINISLEDIMSEDVSSYILEKASEPALKNKLVLELVESEGIENNEIVSAFLARAKELGCKVAIDDFGTGYSNFEYLLKLNADYIKIDGSMIKDIDTNKDSEDIVKAILSFAKSRNLKTVAEFVSSEAVFEKVKSLGIDYSQGYLISAPERYIN